MASTFLRIGKALSNSLERRSFLLSAIFSSLSSIGFLPLDEHPGGGLADEENVPREHGCDAGDLFPLVHHVIPRRVGLEIQGHPARHASHDGEQVAGGRRVTGQLLAQRLHEPRPIGRVAPRVESGDGAVADEKVGVTRDLVGVRVRVGLRGGHAVEADTGVKLKRRTVLN
jgi:hypothetical protein